MRKLIFVAALALGGTASAQTTDCRWIGSVWSCNTNQPPPLSSANPLNYGDAMRAGQALVPDYQQQELRRQQIEEQRQRIRQQQADASYARAQREIAAQRAEREAGIRRDVGNMLASGDCEGAQKLALSTGSIDLANQAKAYCAKPTP